MSNLGGFFFWSRYMHLVKAINDDEVDIIVEALKKCDWYDGKGSARGSAKDKKVNSQAYANQENFTPINEILNDVFFNRLKHYVFPSKLVGVRGSVYTHSEQGRYDWHVDYSHMEGSRTDISFTLFLSDKTKYEGGELDIETRGLTYTVKGKTGEMVLYSTGDRHRVRPVTKGTRLVIVGWISTLVQEMERRDALLNIFEIVQGMDALEDEAAKPLKEKLNENYFRIMRLLSN